MREQPIRRRLRRLMAVICCCAALALSGCLDAHSLDQYGYVLGIGVDRGEQKEYLITLMLQNTQLESDSQKTSGFTVVTAESDSLYEAIESLSGSLPFQLNFARTALVVFEASLVTEEGKIERMLDVSLSSLRIRYNANVFLSVSSAKDTLKGMKNELDPNLSRMQSHFVKYSKATGMIPVTNVTMLYESFMSKAYDVMLPLCGVPGEKRVLESLEGVGGSQPDGVGGGLPVKGGMETGLAGAAVLTGSRMTGYLDGPNTQLVLMASGEFREGRLHLPGPDGEEMCVRFKENGAPQYLLSLRGGARAAVTVPLLADIEQPSYLSGISTDEVESFLADALKERTNRVFAGCRSLGSDPIGFGKHAVKAFPDMQSWEQYDWASAYRAMEATFVFEVELMHSPQKSALE